MKKSLLTALLCAAATACALGADDLKISYRTEAKTIMASNGEQVEYYSERYALTKNDGEKKDTLLDYRDFVKYEIDHKKKVISKTTLEDMLKIMDFMAASMEGAPAGALGQAGANPLGLEGAAVTVTNVGTEQVAGRNCEKWEITFGGYTCRVSVDPSLEPPTGLDADAQEKAKKLKGGALPANPAQGGDIGKFYDAIQNIKGVQLKSEVVAQIGLPMDELKEAKNALTGLMSDKLKEKTKKLEKSIQPEDGAAPPTGDIKDVKEEAKKGLLGLIPGSAPAPGEGQEKFRDGLAPDFDADAGAMATRDFKEATEVVVGPLPASLFELPKGYKEVDAGKKMLEDLEKASKKRK